jgi:hypothetical protein
MDAMAVLSDEWIPQATKAVGGMEELRVEPIWNNGHVDGLLLQSSLERVAVFTWKDRSVSLADVSRLRKAMTRAQARRALVYVPKEIAIASPVILLATLSKIEIVRPVSGRSHSFHSGCTSLQKGADDVRTV